METIKKLWAHKFFRIFMWAFFVLLGIYIVAVLVRATYLVNKHFADIKTNAEVEKIHNTKLTMDDVMGKNLPPDPGVNADKTIAGIDANNNGIRDDVELAVFKEYPNSAKTRAVLLQYALTLQLEMTLPILNTNTVTAVIADNDTRAHICIWSISSRSDMKKFIAETGKNEKFVENLQLNNEQRKNYLDNDVYSYIRSYSASNDGCDLYLTTLPN
jgi:hypothetical protein